MKPKPSRILIIEDERTALRALKLILEDEGYTVLEAATGEEGLRLALSQEPDLALLDIRLPDVDGITILQRLRAGYSDAAVIIMTAETSSANAIRATQFGAFDYLSKPIDDEQLVIAVASALERDAKRQAARAVGDETLTRLSRLTPRERQVMDLAAAGRHNREIGEALGISPRTVEVYKARLMEKLQARNLSELIRFALTADRERTT